MSGHHQAQLLPGGGAQADTGGEGPPARPHGKTRLNISNDGSSRIFFYKGDGGEGSRAPELPWF